MLNPIGKKRLTLDQIKAHPWYREKAATLKEVAQHMKTQRQDKVDAYKKEEAAENQKKRNDKKKQGIAKICKKRKMEFDEKLWIQTMNEIKQLIKLGQNAMQEAKLANLKSPDTMVKVKSTDEVK